MAGELVELIRSRIDADFDGECHLTKDEALSIISLIDHLRANFRIEALERENATLRAEKASIIEKAALVAEDQADRARELAGHAKASPFPTESVHASCFLTMAGTGRAIAAAIRNMGGEG